MWAWPHVIAMAMLLYLVTIKISPFELVARPLLEESICPTTEWPSKNQATRNAHQGF